CNYRQHIFIFIFIFSDHNNKRYLFPGFVYDSEAGARATPLMLTTELFEMAGVSTKEICHVYYNGGCKYGVLLERERGEKNCKYEKVSVYYIQYMDVPRNYTFSHLHFFINYSSFSYDRFELDEDADLSSVRVLARYI